MRSCLFLLHTEVIGRYLGLTYKLQNKRQVCLQRGIAIINQYLRKKLPEKKVLAKECLVTILFYSEGILNNNFSMKICLRQPIVLIRENMLRHPVIRRNFDNF